jgi:hypothetical protein
VLGGPSFFQQEMEALLQVRQGVGSWGSQAAAAGS